MTVTAPVVKSKFVFPKVADDPKFIWNRQKFLTLGPAGCGKSEFWAEGKAFFIDTEGNIAHLRTKSLACRSYSDFQEIRGLLIQQKEAGTLDVEVIVIDTIDRWLSQIDDAIVERGREKFKSAVSKGLTINTIGDVPEGQGWAWRVQLVLKNLDALCDIGVAVSLIGHTYSRKVKEPQREYDRSTINIGGQLGSSLLGWSNHTLNIESTFKGEDLSRIVRALPSDGKEAKSHGGRVPDFWIWDRDATKNYAKLRSLFT